MKSSILVTGFNIGCLVAAKGATLFGPSLYFQAQDSPFYGGIVDNTGERIYLEDFEDQELNTPFVREPEGLPYLQTTFRSRFDGGAVNGVDGDDGSVDGMTFGGDTWIGINRASNGISSRLSFEFLPDEQGRYPRYVGIVVTRVFDPDLDVDVLFFNEDDRLVFRDGEFDPKEWDDGFEDQIVPGSPLLHRFIGLYHEDGIRHLRLFNVSQVDHLQYGQSIPEPSVAGLLLLSLLGLWKRKRASPLGRCESCDSLQPY